ncbi:MAG: hypothetical protein KJ709_08130 [Nanoarchaeota archaeon]|nr:hypothetical protein [Nanoarchaeota archaeon]
MGDYGQHVQYYRVEFWKYIYRLGKRNLRDEGYRPCKYVVGKGQDMIAVPASGDPSGKEMLLCGLSGLAGDRHPNCTFRQRTRYDLERLVGESEGLLVLAREGTMSESRSIGGVACTEGHRLYRLPEDDKTRYSLDDMLPISGMPYTCTFPSTMARWKRRISKEGVKGYEAVVGELWEALKRSAGPHFSEHLTRKQAQASALKEWIWAAYGRTQRAIRRMDQEKT